MEIYHLGKNSIYVAIVLLSLVGCSTTTYNVAFDSVPRGASIVCDDTDLGMTPGTLKLSEEKYKEIIPHLDLCTASWVSGESKNYKSASFSNNPKGVKQTVKRSRGKGYAQDAEFALKVQNMQSQKRQAEAAETSAYQQRRAADAAEDAADAAENRNNRRCYTSFGITSCY